jgi:hypothetical protein
MFDYAHTPIDFKTSPQQFRGTLTHELSHALIEDLVTGVGAQPMITQFAATQRFWDGGALLSSYWRPPGAAGDNCDEDATRKAAKRAGVEAPKTGYAMTNAMEDLAESLMFFFEDPSALLASCPERFAFIRDNLGTYFDPEHMRTLPVPAPVPVADPLADFGLGILG